MTKVYAVPPNGGQCKTAIFTFSQVLVHSALGMFCRGTCPLCVAINLELAIRINS